jgi:RNA polymerase sigma-70 factor (ECF subfamily)
MTEQNLIQACSQNNAVAQRELYSRYSALMFGICYRYAYRKEDAEDMLQEGFIKIFNHIRSFENKGNFEGWMKRVMVNTCINYLQKNKKFTEIISIELVQHLEVKESSIASKLLGKQVMECLRMMPFGFRTIINLYAIEGYTHKEIAGMLGIPEPTIRSQYIRGKAVLESILIDKKIIRSTNDKLEWMALLNS